MDVWIDQINDFSWKGMALVGVRVILILVLASVALSLSRLALKRVQARWIARSHDSSPENTKRAETLSRLLMQGIMIAIWVMAGLMVLGELGVDIGPVLASAGILGLAVGFGAQNLVRDVISGFFIVLEDQVRAGDVAQINGTGGLVERMNLRTIVLRDLGGVVHYFPNGKIETLSNLTKEWSAYVFDIGVAYKEDTDRVVKVMKDVAFELRRDPELGPNILDDMEVFGVDQFGDSAIVIKARIKTKPIQQWAVGREYLRRLKKAFDASGIEIPFPHRSIYFGEASKPILARLSNSLDGDRRVEAS